jgi:hypothetical protein
MQDRRYVPLGKLGGRPPLHNISNAPAASSTTSTADKYKQVIVKSLPTAQGSILEFQILGVLGQGGFAKCYQVKHVHSQRVYAAKCVKKSMLREKPELFAKVRLYFLSFYFFFVFIGFEFS